MLECSTKKKRRKRVESLSKELEVAYGMEMKRIKANEKRYEIAKRALSWVYFAKRPLSMRELREALAVIPIEDIEKADEDCRYLDRDDFEKPQNVLDSCGSLIMWDRSTDVVGFSHYTVSEYLAANADGNIEPELYVARVCLTYLCFDVFDGEFMTLVRTHKLLPYIARFCGKHISGSNEETLEDLVLSVAFSPSRRQALIELDHYCNRSRSIFHPGWEPLHFLVAWDLALIIGRILSTLRLSSTY